MWLTVPRVIHFSWEIKCAVNRDFKIPMCIKRLMHTPTTVVLHTSTGTCINGKIQRPAQHTLTGHKRGLLNYQTDWAA